MRFALTLLSLKFCVLNICFAAEAVVNADSGSIVSWYKPLLDIGIAGSFIVYLIYDRHVERNRKDKENERWNKMEAVLLEMVASTTKVNLETTLAVKELRSSGESLCAEVKRLVTITSTGNDYRRRVSDME